MILLDVLNIELKTLLNDEIIAIIAFTFLYLTYYFCSDFRWIKNIINRFNETDTYVVKSVYFRRTVGFVLFGMIPLLIILFIFDQPISAYGFAFPSGKHAFFWFICSFLFIVIGSILRPKENVDISYYPEVRKDKWTRKDMAINIFFWSIYLLGYEIALRSMVFFSTLYAFGLWPAIIINSLIYSFIHIFKGPKEAYGAFFLGIFFSLITYYTNSIWIVFIIHIPLAAINDIKAVRMSRKMELNQAP